MVPRRSRCPGEWVVCRRPRAAAGEERARDAVGLEEGGDTPGRGRRLWSRFAIDGCVRVRAFFRGWNADRRTEEYREMLSLAVVAGALLQGLGSAAPPRAPARGCIKLSSCPKGGSSLAAAHDDSEAGIETFARDYEISTSYENGSTCAAQAGENGLDGAFPRRALASTDAATKSWLQLYRSSGAGDAFDSETIKGAATAELVANKFQAGGVHALHAIEQTVGSVRCV